MEKRVRDYIAYLEQEERSAATRRQYRRDIFRFLEYIGEGMLTREAVLASRKPFRKSAWPPP